MRLYLVHHGEAVPEEQDPERPLTAKGRTDARRVAQFAVQRAGVSVSRIAHSEKVRAQQTAEVWRSVLVRAELETDPRLNPSADPRALAEDLARTTQDILFVGHLPFLRQLIAVLVCGNHQHPILMFPTGGAVCVVRGTDSTWSILWMLGSEILASGE